MPNQGESARRKLRQTYDQNKRRVQEVANRRNQRSGTRGNNAPTSFVVTERTTRAAGFGRGGRSVAAASKSRRGTKRFADKTVYRSGAKDKFARAGRGGRGGGRGDNDRRVNNNSRQQRGGRGGARFGGGGGRGGARGKLNVRRRDGKRTNTRGQPKSNDDLDAQLASYQGNAASAGPKTKKAPALTAAELDAQLAAY